MEAFSILQWWEAKATDFPVPAALDVAFTQMIPLPPVAAHRSNTPGVSQGTLKGRVSGTLAPAFCTCLLLLLLSTPDL